MFKTQYHSIFRIHSLAEAVATPIRTSFTDLLLYVVDLYDVLLSVESGALPAAQVGELDELLDKTTNYLLDNYDMLYKTVPGRCLGWTVGMMFYLVIMTLINMKHKTCSLSPAVKTYVKKHRLRLYESPDPNEWTLSDLISMLDVISLRWDKLEPCAELDGLLEILWTVSSRYITQMMSRDKMDVDMYTEEVNGKKSHVRLSEVGIVASMSRFFWCKQLLRLYRTWTIHIEDDTPMETNWDKFITGEKKHFVTRRFRDQITKYMWDRIILIGDKEICSHEQLGGSQVSAMTCVFGRFPAGIPSLFQKTLTYAEPEEVLENRSLRDFCYINMIQQHFMAVYNVNWPTYFLVFDVQVHRHKEAIERSVVPIVMKIMGCYYVYFKNTLIKNPSGGSFEHAFILWCYVLREQCDSKCFDSMDFSPIIEQILEVGEMVDNTREVVGFFDLDDDF